MIDRFASGFDPFVIPFLIGMIFVLGYCIIGAIRLILQLDAEDKKKFFLSLITPKTIWKNIKDLFLNCLIHALQHRVRMVHADPSGPYRVFRLHAAQGEAFLLPYLLQLFRR